MARISLIQLAHSFRGACFLFIATAALSYYLTAISTAYSQSSELEGRLKNIATADIRKWMNSPIIIESIKEQNIQHDVLSLAEIEKLDKDWKLQTNNVNQPLIKKIIETPLSEFLRQKQNASDGLYREIIVMDNRGLLVGSSLTSTDYWQGDEDKWRKTFKVGSGAIFVDEVRYDDSAEAFQAQVSLSISDGEDVIGAITVGVDTEKMEYRNH